MLPIALMAGAAGANIAGSYLQARGTKAAAKANAKTMKELAEQQRADALAAYGDVSFMYQPQIGVGARGLSELQKWQATAAPSEFQYGKTVNDFLDPSIAFQQQQLRQTQEAGAASRGSLLSSGAQRQMQDLALKQAQTDYANSWNRMNADQGNKYQQYLDFFNNSRAVNNDRLQRINQMVNVGQNATSNVANARLGQSATNQQANQTQYNAQGEYNQVRDGGNWNTAGSALQAVGQGLSGAAFYQMQNPSVSPVSNELPAGFYRDASGNIRNGAGVLVKQGNV